MKEDERILGNNDAPIVIGDTSIPIHLMGAPTKDETTVTHQAPRGTRITTTRMRKTTSTSTTKRTGTGKTIGQSASTLPPSRSLSQSQPMRQAGKFPSKTNTAIKCFR